MSSIDRSDELIPMYSKYHCPEETIADDLTTKGNQQFVADYKSTLEQSSGGVSR